MHDSPTENGPDLTSSVLYTDARGGIDFLNRAFGFAENLLVPDGRGGLAHVELRLGHSLLMLGDARPERVDFKTPREVGATTGAIYIATPEVDALFERATAAGAMVVAKPFDTDYGARNFTVRDADGNLWSAGTYHPTADASAGADTGREQPPEIYATTRYADAKAAIAFLKNAFGFQEHYVVPDEGDGIAHAQLRYGTSLFMLSSLARDTYGMKTPRQLGGVNTLGLYLVVRDADAHYARAKAAGAEIVDDPADTNYGSRNYVARDPEGFVWTFGTYRPHIVRATSPAS
jgi:uncharacterized glyoxalase superfamily protein PhnB